MIRTGALALSALLGCSEPAPSDEPPREPELGFSEQWGTDGDDFARSLAIDEAGDVFVTGFTGGAFEGATNAGGIWDAFLTRASPDGERDWSAQWGSAEADFAQVVTSASGGVLVAGYSPGAIDEQANAGGLDAFLTRYEASGERSWTRQWGSAGDDYVYAAASSENGLFVVGYTQGAFTGSTNAGEADVFVTHLDDAGEPLWTWQRGTSTTDYGQAVRVDTMGNVLVAGYTKGALGDDPNVGSEDAFLIKLDTAGELVWLRQWGSDTTDYGLSLTSDAAGNVYVTGYTYGSVDGQPSGGGEDAFLSKFDPDGVLLWTREWGSFAADSARFVTLASDGDVLVVGDTEGAIEGQISFGERDAFLLRFSPDGERVFAAQWGTEAREFSLSAAAAGRDVFVAGYSESANLEREALLTKWSF